MTRAKLLGCFAGMALAITTFAYAAENGTSQIVTPQNDVPQAAAELRRRYAADLEKLAAWCDGNDLPAEAKKTRRVLSPSDPYKLYVATLPETVGPAKLAADTAPKVVEWNDRLWQLRRKYAAAAFELARQAVRSGRPGRAYSLVLAAAAADPDHERARHLLGYENYENQWRTAYEIKKLRAGFVWNEKFGWLPKSHLARYENGERYVAGRWISAEQDALHHRDIRAGWIVETEHYAIRTNQSIEGAVALGVKLERLHRLWRQLFIGYYASDADVAAWFDGRTRLAKAAPARHQIRYFRDRDDYNNSLRPKEPNIDISVGYYNNDLRLAFFFAAKDSDDRTIYHEATHQLFNESKAVSPVAWRNTNFWITEGVAMYMESLRVEDGYTVLGSFDDERMAAARYRLLKKQFYVPLGSLVDYGRDRFEHDSQIQGLYSEAAGLTYFLICYDGGLYRDKLVAYLTAVYSARDNHDTLSNLCGEKYEELDRQYREFLTKERTKNED